MLFRGLWSVFPRARVYLIVCINMISPRSSDPKPEQCPWMYSLLSPGDRDRVLRVCTSRNDRVTLCSAVVSFRFFRENTFNYGRARNASFVPRRTACGLTVSYIRYKIYHARIHIIIIIIIHVFITLLRTTTTTTRVLANRTIPILYAIGLYYFIRPYKLSLTLGLEKW